jgi:hypothetical protein
MPVLLHGLCSENDALNISHHQQPKDLRSNGSLDQGETAANID